MNERLIYEDADFKSTYFFDEEKNLVVRLLNKVSNAFYDTVYDSRQAHKAAKKWNQ